VGLGTAAETLESSAPPSRTERRTSLKEQCCDAILIELHADQVASNRPAGTRLAFVSTGL
jgi:hypothetical protein